ncbi:hypothetical protein AMTRI_Chr05g63370 [Amborella trichopoda]
MIYSKRLLQMAHKWQKHAIKQKKRISFKRELPIGEGVCLVADEGHFVIYTVDGNRFMILLAYLNRSIFRELLSMMEEEFGFTRCGPLQVPYEHLLWSA